MTNSSLTKTIQESQSMMNDQKIDGWLLYDYRGMNPILWDTIGHIPHVTRPCWFWIPREGSPEIICSYVDQNRFEKLDFKTNFWVSRNEMIGILKKILQTSKKIAMEYSPLVSLPRISKVDAGTIELIKSLGVDVISSADLVQFSTQRWDEKDLNSHLKAADILTSTVKSAFDFIGSNINSNPYEFEIAEYIRDMFKSNNLYSPDGPVVAANYHSADPHFEPTKESSNKIFEGDWILIDLWGCLEESQGMYADITWTAYVGDKIPEKNQSVFSAVIGGRDQAVEMMKKSHSDGEILQGWQLDKIARDYISSCGYGEYFSHRLGHSLGREVHSNAVNLDGWETHDTRSFIPQIAVTVEPGVYLPKEFGVRSEIDIFYYPEGPEVTTEIQTEPYIIR